MEETTQQDKHQVGLRAGALRHTWKKQHSKTNIKSV